MLYNTFKAIPSLRVVLFHQGSTWSCVQFHHVVDTLSLARFMGAQNLLAGEKKCLLLEWADYTQPGIPSRELTYPTLGKGKSSSKCHFWGIC